MRVLLGTALATATLVLAGCSTYGYPGYGYPSSNTNSQYGQYGYGSSGNAYGNSGTVRCESNDERTRTCAVDTRGGVRLVRQLSDSPCIQGRSWGYDGRGIWVGQGCRADFEVGSGAAYGDSGYGGQSQVRCESQDNRRRDCSVRVPRNVTLVRQLSDAACVQGRTWGWNRSGIWVDRGCRAEFAIR